MFSVKSNASTFLILHYTLSGLFSYATFVFQIYFPKRVLKKNEDELGPKAKSGNHT